MRDLGLNLIKPGQPVNRSGLVPAQAIAQLSPEAEQPLAPIHFRGRTPPWLVGYCNF
jgi:hypothetical protein